MILTLVSSTRRKLPARRAKRFRRFSNAGSKRKMPRMIVERTRADQRPGFPSLFRSRPLGFVNRKMFSFRSNLALFMA
jgi:hypothetical protein